MSIICYFLSFRIENISTQCLQLIMLKYAGPLISVIFNFNMM